MAKGYMEKILRVDLSKNEVREEPFPEDWKKKYLGSSGVGARIIYDEVPPDVDAFDPRNVVTLFVGPYSASPAPMSGRYGMATKSPLTGGWGEASCSGFWAVDFKHAGYDGIVITGKADKPVYLWIEDGKVELLPAGELWGKTTIETEEALTAKHGEKARVLSIGPAGEKLVRYACVISDEGRAAGRSGIGAVLGSKNFKAIVVRGTGKTPIADPERFDALRKEITSTISKSIGAATMGQGTACSVAAGESGGDFPVKNWRLANFTEGAQRLDSAGDYTKILVKKWPCSRCPMGCGRWVKIDREIAGVKPFTGHGPEYESLAVFGGALMIDDIEVVAAAHHLCNLYGVDVISAGTMTAFAFEAFEKGIITEDDVGFKLEWGDGEAAVKLARMIAERKGLGELLGEGPIKAAQKLGKGAEEFAMHAKGQPIPGHDPRTYAVVAAEYAISNRGACHLQGFTETWQSVESLYIEALGLDPETSKFFGITFGPKHDTAGKGAALAKCMAASNTIDALAVCKFFFLGLGSGNEVAELTSAIMGEELTRDDFLEIGERLVSLKRAYNIRCGFTPKDDTLPARLLTPAPDAGEKHVAPDMQAIIKDFYQAMDWDLKTGKPSKERLIQLGLEDVAKDLWK